jgi:hypothetical protein
MKERYQEICRRVHALRTKPAVRLGSQPDDADGTTGSNEYGWLMNQSFVSLLKYN